MKTIDTLTPDEARVVTALRALANPARVRIVRELAAHPGCMTGGLTELLPLAASTVSEHLGVLKEAGIVRGTIEDERCYCLDPGVLEEIITFCEELRAAAIAAGDQSCC